MNFDFPIHLSVLPVFLSMPYPQYIQSVSTILISNDVTTEDQFTDFSRHILYRPADLWCINKVLYGTSHSF